MERSAEYDPDVLRLKPAKLWCLVVGDYVTPFKHSPKYLTAIITAGRSKPHTVLTIMAVIETAKVINRIFERHEHYGV